MPFQRRKERDIILEYIQQGSYIKVSAIDARSGFEVSIVGDAKLSQKQLDRAAIRKLEFMMKKRRQERQRGMKQHTFYRHQAPGSTSGWDL